MSNEERQKLEQEHGQKPKQSHGRPPWNISLSIFGPFRKLFEPSQRLVEPYAKKGQVVADLGCRTGFYTLILAEAVGPEGKVYAVDLDKNCIQTLEKKAEKAGYHNIEAHATSAADLSFIKDNSVDFILANGLLWSMATDRQLSVKEMKRILKSDGQVYLSLGAPPPFGKVVKAEWEQTLAGFSVEQRGGSFEKWAVVFLK